MARLPSRMVLTIPAGRSVQGGGCTVRSDATLYGLGPHMHQLGVHMRVTVIRSGAAELEIYDDSYDFNHQLFYDIDPVQLASGDRVNVECTYENDTGRTVNWGDSSLDEMCFASLGLYPAGSYGSLPCFN